jgi:hypothetical protein
MGSRWADVSPSVFIVVHRRLAGGSWVSSKAAGATDVSYVVRYRLGGRGARLQHGGTFRTRRDAKRGFGTSRARSPPARSPS